MSWSPGYSWTGAPTEFNGTDSEYGGDSSTYCTCSTFYYKFSNMDAIA
jgi:hypothetical protein